MLLTYAHLLLIMFSGEMDQIEIDQILRRERGRRSIHCPCSADHEQDWQPYPVDPSLAIGDDHTYIHAYIHTYMQAIRLLVDKDFDD